MVRQSCYGYGKGNGDKKKHFRWLNQADSITGSGMGDRAAPYRLLIASKLANEQQGAAQRIADGIDKRVVGNEVDITIVSRTE